MPMPSLLSAAIMFAQHKNHHGELGIIEKDIELQPESDASKSRAVKETVRAAQ